jgi:hypothetical protein
MKLDRNVHIAGSFERISALDQKNWSRKGLNERFSYGIMMHLLNHGVTLDTFSFTREFVKAYKRK